ncbi:GNAT family N-acetyltransferase [Neobacillus sp. FSL H8-0543]|uniref:GNAT family N-acetyltransferase n=1 Tax=Neobacillus sp. FSL H8-0543 TaxID=2954672 RepID=UPI00315842E1
MLNVEIRRPRIEDSKELNGLFRTVITDTFIKEGIGDKLDDMEEEIRSKKAYLKSDFESNGEKRYFLIALAGGKIIGSIENGPSSELIRKCTDSALKELNEVGTVFVHPEYQWKGVGSFLLNKMYLNLRNNGIDEFCLDSGYVRAQTIWTKKFGVPDYLLMDYWGEGFPHMIWRLKVDDLLK